MKSKLFIAWRPVGQLPEGPEGGRERGKSERKEPSNNTWKGPLQLMDMAQQFGGGCWKMCSFISMKLLKFFVNLKKLLKHVRIFETWS